MSPLEPSNTTIVDSEKCNIAEARGKDFIIAFINMIEVLKEQINKSLKEIYLEKMNKTVQYLKVKIQSIKKIQLMEI